MPRVCVWSIAISYSKGDLHWGRSVSQALGYEISKAGWHDLNSLRKLDHVCFHEDAWPIWDLITVLVLPNIVRLKAVEKDQMAGFIAGDPHTREGVGWIAMLGVFPEYRRLGIAWDLLARCEEELHLPIIRLSVRRDNTAAIGLYQRAGYHMIDVWRRYYHSGQDALVFEKRR
jgi:N-alpha-acetyltransferase 10/11